MPSSQFGAPQLQQPPAQSLQQSFQQHNQLVHNVTTPKVPWALSKAEKKNYDQIFRAWDASGSGFIDGSKALEVFGQSGLGKNDLARIWSVYSFISSQDTYSLMNRTLADSDNRGKLNMAEFHVAMGLIYRSELLLMF